MNGTLLIHILTLSLCLWSVCTCMGSKQKGEYGDDILEKEPEPGVMRFRPPALNEEEEHSYHMPENLKCDGCKAVAYQLSQGFKKVEGPKSRKLKESEILDVTESVCSSAFENYGVKEYKGGKHLSGPGMPAEGEPGVTQGGGSWPIRLEDICSHYLGELGEEAIYEAYRSRGDKTLGHILCEEKNVFGSCSQNKDEL